MAQVQFTEEVDRVLNIHEGRLAHVLKMIEDYTGEKDELWNKVFALFDEQVGPGKPARFIADDEYVLHRSVPDIKPTINADKLKEQLEGRYAKDYASKMWIQITDPKRSLNQQKLAKAVERGRIPIELLEASLVTPPATPRRLRTEATQQDILFLRLGKQDGESVEEEEAAEVSA